MQKLALAQQVMEGIGGGATQANRKGEQRWSHGPRRRAAILLFEADVSQVSVVDADDAVVLLEEALLLGLAPPLQTLDQQAQSPASKPLLR